MPFLFLVEEADGEQQQMHVHKWQREAETPLVCFSSMNSPEELGDHSQGQEFSQWSQAEYTIPKEEDS